MTRRRAKLARKDRPFAELKQTLVEAGAELAQRLDMTPEQVGTFVQRALADWADGRLTVPARLVGRGHAVHMVDRVPFGVAVCGSRPGNPGEQWLPADHPPTCGKCIEG